MAHEYLAWAARTDKGRKRSGNEDAHACIPRCDVFCVADGMGGMAAGEMASATVVGAVQDRFTELAAAGSADALSAMEKAELAVGALREANTIIRRIVRERELETAGSTVVLAAFDRNHPARVAVVHCGDSRAYLLRKGRLRQMTTDHSVAQAVGAREENLAPMFRSVVTRAIGTLEEIKPDCRVEDTQPGDVLLLCSDGLSRMVNDRKIEQLLSRGIHQPLVELADLLVAEANAAGGHDNITVILVHAPDTDSQAEMPTRATLFSDEGESATTTEHGSEATLPGDIGMGEAPPDTPAAPAAADPGPAATGGVETVPSAGAAGDDGAFRSGTAPAKGDGPSAAPRSRKGLVVVVCFLAILALVWGAIRLLT